jgi:two-component system, OmpR family, sensor histidine kinase CssS
MRIYKTTIRKKIFFSHISIIAISLLLTFAAFNLCLDFSIRKQTRGQLLEAARTIEQSMIESLKGLNINQNYDKSNKVIRNLLKNSRNLKQNKLFLDINYMIIGENQALIYPEKNDKEEYTLVKNNLLPLVKEKILLKSRNIKKTGYYFNIDKKKYGALIYPLKLLNNKDGYLIVYTNLINSKGFIEVINIILLVILIITAFISVLISNNISLKISQPISLLSDYARKIGERQYDAEFIEYDRNDEIGHLAETMHSMVRKLFTYDSTMKTFIQNASHEMRTPLMSIQGYAEGIKYGVVEEQDKAISIIIEESKRLSDLVEDLLFLSKIEALNEQFNLEEVDIVYIIQSSIERVSGISIKNKKTIKFSSDYSTFILQGDEEKLTRAVINILANCLRYSEESIEVSLEKEDSKVIIIIEDDGPGFDEEEIGSIFDRFFKGKGGNYGLGLTITKSIIEKHGGSVVAENNIKGGARFKIVL